MKALAIAALAPMLLAACASSPANDDDDGFSPAPDPHPGWAKFIALGDAGTGDADQVRVAAAVATVCASLGCDFAIDLGDLIYPSGADSPTDPEFDAKFEVPYAALDFPFYMALGNHDNYGTLGGAAGYGLDYSAGNHMVAYAQRMDRASGKWVLPDRHYSFNVPNVTFIVLDTNTLGFHDVPVAPGHEEEIEAQAAFVQAAVASTSTPWLFAMGHHPYISNGPHGDAGSYDGAPTNGDYVKAFFEEHLCGRVQVYFAGHDHNLQWLGPVPSCGTTEFVVSGGGGAGTYDLGDDHAARFQQQTLGFWWFEANATVLRGVAFDGDGKALFEHALTK